jgi:hypothetical protein
MCRFGPLRPSSGIYKQQNVFTLITNLRDAIDLLLIVFSYMFLHKITMFNYTKILFKLCSNMYKIIIFSFANKLYYYIYGGFMGEV